MRIELLKRVNYRDGELEAVNLELENLTGYDVLSAESELRAAGVQVVAWETSREFLLTVAAKASHLPSEVLKSLGAQDFMRIINEVMIFLAGPATQPATVKNSGK